jgi:hypothetical protein
MTTKNKRQPPEKVKYNTSTHLYKALESKYLAERDGGLATLNVYFHNSVGIGEHPQMIEEMAKQLEKVSNADDNLKTLSEYYGELG